MKLRPMNVFAFSLIALFVLLGLFMLWGAASASLKAWRTASWPTTQGVLQSVAIEESAGSDGPLYKAGVSYRYTVAGVEYSGSVLSFGYSASNGREAHETIVRKLQSAKQVLVRYNPVSPKEACLAAGLSRSHYLQLTFAVMWLVFSLGFLFLLILFVQDEAKLLEGIVVLEMALT